MIYFLLHYMSRGYGPRIAFQLARNRQREARKLRREGVPK